MTRKILRNGKVIAIALCALFTAESYATPMFFTDDATFQTALAGQTLSVESFETAFTDASTVNFSGFSTTVVGGGVLWSLPSSNGAALPTDGVRTIGMVDFQFNGNQLTFQFNSPINAFAIDIIGALDVFNFGTLSLSNNKGASQVILTAPQHQPPVETHFGGLIDNTQTFSSVTITSTQTGDGIQFDRLQFGAFTDNGGGGNNGNVPEPGTLLLMILGLAGLGFAKRKSRGSKNIGSGLAITHPA